MGQFLNHFVPAGIDPRLYWLVVFIVVTLLVGVMLIVVGKLGDHPARTTFSSAWDHPQRARRVQPGRAFWNAWPRYLEAYRARGGLGSPLVQPPDEFGGDAFLRDTRSGMPNTSPLSAGAPALLEQTPSLPPQAAPLPYSAPVVAGPAHPPAEVPRQPATPSPPAGSVPPVAFQLGRPPLAASGPRRPPGWDAETAPAPEEAVEPGEQDEAGGRESDRLWMILPSRFPLVPPTQAAPATSATPAEEAPPERTMVPSRVEEEPAPSDILAADEETPLVPTTTPVPVGSDTSPATAAATASSRLTAPAAASPPPSVLEEATPPNLPRREAAEAVAAAVTGSSAPAGATLAEEAGPLPTAAGALLEIHGFGEAHLRVKGQVVPMRKATKELELALYLAHKAAPSQAQGKEIPATYRETVADALWASQPDEDLQAKSLKNTKLHLCKRLLSHAADLEEAVWLESSQGRATLRLAQRVVTDLAAFLRLTGALTQAARSAERSRLPVQEVEAWLNHLQQLYQGGFALQFRDEEWAQSARAGYRQQYLDALFDVACLLAHLGRRRQAILLGKDLLLEEDVSADTLLPRVLDWLEQEGGKGEVAQWREEYRRRYAYKYQRSLAEDRPEQEALFRQVLHPAVR